MNDAMMGLLLGVGIPTLIGLGCGLLAKFAPREKCAAWAWAWIERLLNLCDKVMTLKVGPKSAEQVEESVWGTIGYVLNEVGEKILVWLKLHDDDGSIKG